MRLILLCLVFVVVACERFEVTENADVFYHIEAEGAEIPVWIKGNTSSDKFVIFINGGPGLTSIDIASIDMLGWSESFEKEFAMVYYDQRGTGNAQGNIDPATITLEQYLVELRWIVESVKSQYSSADVYLMGHSFGGFIGQNFLLEQANQDLVSGWININSSTIIDIDKEWVYRLQFLEDLAQEKLKEDSVKWSEVLIWIDENDPITTSEQKNEWRSFIGHPGMGVLPDEIIELSTGGVFRAVFASSYNIFPSYLSSNLNDVNHLLYEDIKGSDLLPELHKIEIPVLTLWGKYDDIIPPQLGEAAFAYLGTPEADKEFIVFEESGHQPFINEAEKFEAAVSEFVFRKNN
jgi:pimeloyl-ACP methyl ester carboxylesterase